MLIFQRIIVKYQRLTSFKPILYVVHSKHPPQLATLENYHKTSKKLYTTQPAISNRIATLEKLIGSRLFERDTRSVFLTAKGRELLPYAEKILKLTEQFHELTGIKQEMTGLLRLGVSETIVHTWLPIFLRKLHEKYPKLDVELTVDITINLKQELLYGWGWYR